MGCYHKYLDTCLLSRFEKFNSAMKYFLSATLTKYDFNKLSTSMTRL